MFDEARPMAKLPEKQPGKHRFIVSAVYVLSDQQARDSFDPDTEKFLDHESLFALSAGCWDCEKQLGGSNGVTWDSVCPAEASDD